MAQVHIRIVAALIALSVLALTVLGAIYMYRETIEPERQAQQEVKKLMEQKAPKVDPGKKVHDQAMDLIRRREMDAAREKLTEVIEVYRDSERYGPAREVLGEINMDRLFDRRPMAGKLEYPVAPKDSLNGIATRFRTSVSYIKRVNQLFGAVIHPGDHLVVYPLDFELEVNFERKVMTLLKDGRFFKDYTILGHHLPKAKINRETTIGEIYGWLNDKKVRPDNENFSPSPKWVQTSAPKGASGIIFCPEPPPPPEGTPPSPSGIYLSREDMEELSTVLRPGITVRFLKTGKS